MIFIYIYICMYTQRDRERERERESEREREREKDIYIYIYRDISATALLAVRRASCYSVPLWSWYLCMRLLSTGPWDPWVWGTCSGSVLALRLGMEVIVLGTPHPRSQFSRCYSVPLRSGKKQHFKMATQKYTK